MKSYVRTKEKRTDISTVNVQHYVKIIFELFGVSHVKQEGKQLLF